MTSRSKGRSGRLTRRLLCLLAVAFVALLSATAAFASTWTTGDIFVGVESGNYNVYDNAGVFKETINAGTGFTTGCAFNNDQSKLFTTYFSDGTVEAFDTPHPHTSALFAGGLSTPESVVFNQLGDVFVSSGSSGAGMREYDASGTLLNTILSGRTDWIDLAADQTTMFYTDEGPTIHRIDVSTPGGTPLPDFTTVPGDRFAALRILPDGSVLAANEDANIQRFNAAGAPIQTYNAPGEANWFALNLDPNGTSFWSADFNTADVVKFNIASGAVEGSFNSGAPTNTFGLCLKGEITVGGGDTTPPTCTLIATIPGPPKSIQVEVQDTGSGLATIAHSETNAVTVVPPFAPGTTSPVVVDSTKVDQTKASSLQLTVTDVAGNQTVCDPVVPGSLMRAHARPHHRFSLFKLLRLARLEEVGG